jgi:enoyl-CoA hydratase/carnithine racemase
MEYNEIVVEIEEHLRIITINKPKAMNSVSPLTSQEMEHAMNEFCDNKDEWVCIITGAGDRAFCAGNDLKWQSQNMDIIAKEFGKLECGFAGITSRKNCYKPVIAAVNGVALGGGFEIALASDIIIASENATFGLPEPRVGMIAMAGGVHRLPRQIPYHLAMEMMLTARKIDAAEARKLGIVNEIAAAGELMDTARKYAKEIMKGAPLAIQATKESVIDGKDMPVEEAIEYKGPIFQAMMKSSDVMEGSMAFIEKREPNWKGA